MILRAKFSCESVTLTSYGNTVKLRTLYTNNKEDNQFSEATPNGELSMSVTTEVGKNFFKPGGKYYLEFTEAPE